jgi:hypothetical protein
MMKIDYKTAVIFTGVGVVITYIGLRIAAPTIRENIAKGVAEEIVARQNTSFGFSVINYNDAVAQVGMPIGERVIRSMWLA